jgi:hypothetical protein
LDLNQDPQSQNPLEVEIHHCSPNWPFKKYHFFEVGILMFFFLLLEAADFTKKTFSVDDC